MAVNDKTWYIDPINGDDSEPNAYGWWKVNYTAGSVVLPLADETGTGDISGATCKLTYTPFFFNGVWSDPVGTANGIAYFYGKVGTFVAETITFTNGGKITIAEDLSNSAWKTLANGSNGKAGIRSEFRIAKSDSAPIDIGNATWTNRDPIISLATARTQTVNNCDVLWTKGASSNLATPYLNTSEYKLAPASNRWYASSWTLSTLQAFAPVDGVGAQDYSAYQNLSFMFKTSRRCNADSFKMCLCSDTAGTVIVDEFIIPYNNVYGNWIPFVLPREGGGNLGSSIQSVAFYTHSSAPYNGSYEYIDNIIVSKTGDLDHQSLITKDSAELTDGDDDGLFNLFSIDGTECRIGAFENQTPNSTMNNWSYYVGTTETVTTYIRKTMLTDPMPTSSTAIGVWFLQSTQDRSSVYYGYNPQTNLMDGLTLIDNLNGGGNGGNTGNADDTKVYNFSAVRCQDGFVADDDMIDGTFSQLVGCEYGLSRAGSNTAVISKVNGSCCLGTFEAASEVELGELVSKSSYRSIWFQTGAGKVDINIHKVYGAYDGINLGVSKLCEIKYMYVYEVYDVAFKSYGGGMLKIRSADSDGNARNEISVYNVPSKSYLSVGRYNGGEPLYQSGEGKAVRQPATAGGTGKEWKLTGTPDSDAHPFRFKIASVKVYANQTNTVSVWAKMVGNGTSNQFFSILVPAYQLDGMTTPSETFAINTGDRQKVSTSFTTTETGVIDIWVTQNISDGYQTLVDDFEITAV